MQICLNNCQQVIYITTLVASLKDVFKIIFSLTRLYQFNVLSSTLEKLIFMFNSIIPNTAVLH